MLSAFTKGTMGKNTCLSQSAKETKSRLLILTTKKEELIIFQSTFTVILFIAATPNTSENYLSNRFPQNIMTTIIKERVSFSLPSFFPHSLQRQVRNPRLSIGPALSNKNIMKVTIF